MQTVRVAVVGVGSLGQHHARIYSETPGAELVAVVDRRPEQAGMIASQFNCRSYRNLDSLPGDVEAVSLATPTSNHCEMGCRLMKRGIHVLIEKPISATLEEAEQLLEARRRNGCILQVGHTERFNPVLQTVRPYIKAPRFFEAHRLGVFVRRSLDVDVVLDLMIHDLDLILWMVNDRIAEIRAVGIPVLTPKVDIANARLEFEHGCVANITASRVSKERIRKLRLFQASDYISLDFHERTVEMYSLVSQEGGKKIIERKPQPKEGEPLRAEIEAFLGSVRGVPSPISCTAEEATQALGAALKILSQIR